MTERHQRPVRGQALVVEQDRELRRWLEELLTSWGFAVASAGDGDSALAVVGQQALEVAVLGEGLAATERGALARRLREACAVVLVAARGERPLAGVEDRAGSGHPASATAVAQAAWPGGISCLGDLEIDWQSLDVRRHGERIELSQQDLRLLCALVGHSGHVLSRCTLLRLVWGCDYLGSSRMVDMAIRRLRERLEEDPASPRYIRTVRGQGYRFEAP